MGLLLKKTGDAQATLERAQVMLATGFFPARRSPCFGFMFHRVPKVTGLAGAVAGRATAGAGAGAAALAGASMPKDS